jgi:cell division protein FtsB
MIDTDIPENLNADVAGLPPERAELARLLAWRRALTDEIALLARGREDLKAHISRLEKQQAVIFHLAIICFVSFHDVAITTKRR